MVIEYRLARFADLPEVGTVFAAAIDDLDKRHGFFVEPAPVVPHPQCAFWLKKDPAAFWVAEDKGRLVGYSFSYLRGSRWYLADLFVRPGLQGKGVGRTLIEKTLGSWKGHRITSRSLITPAFNPISVSLYMRFGMLPRQPVYFASAARKEVARSLRAERLWGLEVEEISGSKNDLSVMSRIHSLAMGFAPGWHNEFFFEVEKARCFLFKKAGRPEGYAFLRKDGRIGPLVVKAEKSFGPALYATLKRAAEGDSKEITIFFAGTNPEAVRISIRERFRITYPLLFLSSGPTGDWTNYLFCTPDLM